jgi:hypothetical protein
VDANSHQGTLDVLDRHMEVMEHGIAWYRWRHLNGTQWRKETATEAVAVYQATIGNVSQMDSVVLHHHARIDEILLKWTKEHLDAYLASADVIIDQRERRAGLIFIFPGLPHCMHC